MKYLVNTVAHFTSILYIYIPMYLCIYLSIIYQSIMYLLLFYPNDESTLLVSIPGFPHMIARYINGLCGLPAERERHYLGVEGKRSEAYKCHGQEEERILCVFDLFRISLYLRRLNTRILS